MIPPNPTHSVLLYVSREAIPGVTGARVMECFSVLVDGVPLLVDHPRVEIEPCSKTDDITVYQGRVCTPRDGRPTANITVKTPGLSITIEAYEWHMFDALVGVPR